MGATSGVFTAPAIMASVASTGSVASAGSHSEGDSAIYTGHTADKVTTTKSCLENFYGSIHTDRNA